METFRCNNMVLVWFSCMNPGPCPSSSPSPQCQPALQRGNVKKGRQVCPASCPNPFSLTCIVVHLGAEHRHQRCHAHTPGSNATPRSAQHAKRSMAHFGAEHQGAARGAVHKLPGFALAIPRVQGHSLRRGGLSLVAPCGSGGIVTRALTFGTL